MKFFSSIFLVLILNLPVSVGLLHLIEDHHNHCEDQSLHYHKIELECSTCDYLRVVADNELHNNELLFSFLEKKYIFKDLFYNETSQNFIELYNSRGPPRAKPLL